MEDIFFKSWDGVFRTLIVGVFAYTGLILMLRISGSRTLSQLNAFDLIVSVALGSTLATVILNKNVPLVDGLVALALLIVLQFAISTLTRHTRVVEKLVKTQPYILFYRGSFIQDALDKHRIAEDEILQMIRSNGISDLDQVDAVVLETNGQFSVIKKVGAGERSTLENIGNRKVVTGSQSL